MSSFTIYCEMSPSLLHHPVYRFIVELSYLIQVDLQLLVSTLSRALSAARKPPQTLLKAFHPVSDGSVRTWLKCRLCIMCSNML